MPNERLWLVQGLKRDVPLVIKTRAHAVGGSSQRLARWLLQTDLVPLMDQVITLPVRRFERHALWISLERRRTTTSAWHTERTADLPYNVPLVVGAGCCCHHGTVAHVSQIMASLIKLESAACGRFEHRVFQLGVIPLSLALFPFHLAERNIL